MLTDENKKELETLMDVFITKLKQNNLLKNPSEGIYQDVSQRLYVYYKYGESDSQLKAVLNDFQEDIYFNIIPLFYKNKYTIDNIANIMNCDTSTVVRNKKRLCTSIYLLLQQ